MAGKSWIRDFNKTFSLNKREFFSPRGKSICITTPSGNVKVVKEWRFVKQSRKRVNGKRYADLLKLYEFTAIKGELAEGGGYYPAAVGNTALRQFGPPSAVWFRQIESFTSSTSSPRSNYRKSFVSHHLAAGLTLCWWCLNLALQIRTISYGVVSFPPFTALHLSPDVLG